MFEKKNHSEAWGRGVGRLLLEAEALKKFLKASER